MQGISNIIGLCVFIIVAIISLYGIILIPFYIFFTFFNSKKRGEKANAKLLNTLMSDEQIIEQAIQHRVFAFFSRRKVIAITNSRILTISRGIFGGYKMQDIQWKDLDDAQISENVLPQYCGSNLTFDYTAHNSKSTPVKGVIEVLGIPTKVATSIYSKAQLEEHAWEEKRRVRDLEDKRAVAGGITVNTGNAQHGHETLPHTVNSIAAEIEKIKNLLDVGAINDSEYQEMKSKILSRNF